VYNTYHKSLALTSVSQCEGRSVEKRWCGCARRLESRQSVRLPWLGWSDSHWLRWYIIEFHMLLLPRHFRSLKLQQKDSRRPRCSHLSYSSSFKEVPRVIRFLFFKQYIFASIGWVASVPDLDITHLTTAESRLCWCGTRNRRKPAD
jgi:hypothetical protein